MQMYEMTRNPMQIFREDSPTFRRMDIAYGKGSARLWVFDVLQATLGFLGVTNDRFTKEQIIDLAGTIVASPLFGTLKMGEFLLFLSRFKSGSYGRFYGGDSYALVITEALHTFWSERSEYYAQIEREEAEKKIAEERKQPKMTFKEWKAIKEANGEKVNIGMSVVEERGKELHVLNPIESLVESAQNLVTNKYGLQMKSLLEMRKAFREQNGMTPEEVIEKHNNNEL